MHCIIDFETGTREKLYDLERLKELLGGNMEFLSSLAGIYLTTIPANSKEMTQASINEDWLKVSKLAHKMKPTIESMNIESILADIRTLEADAKNEVNTHKLAKLALKVDQVVNSVADQLRYEFNL